MSHCFVAGCCLSGCTAAVAPCQPMSYSPGFGTAAAIEAGSALAGDKTVTLTSCEDKRQACISFCCLARKVRHSVAFTAIIMHYCVATHRIARCFKLLCYVRGRSTAAQLCVNDTQDIVSTISFMCCNCTAKRPFAVQSVVQSSVSCWREPKRANIYLVN